MPDAELSAAPVTRGRGRPRGRPARGRGRSSLPAGRRGRPRRVPITEDIVEVDISIYSYYE